jgi:CubicO group peptidase (beta-lactamase class C family)
MRLALAPAVSFLPVFAWGQGVPRPDDAELTRRIEAYVAPLAANELSGTLLVARGHRVLVERSFGFASYELRVPFTPTTPTNVASITKPLTIIITSRLAEARKLSVNDTVSKWLPEYLLGSRMTVTQLLNHRAGVPHRLLPDDQQEEPRTAHDMVQAANKLPLLFEPGAQSVYSSGGYAILAAVLERASGKRYDELLQEHVAQPVGARTIRHADRREMLPGRAESVIPTGGGMLNAPLRDLSFLVGGGSVYTTPRDLFDVMQGVVSGTYGAAARTALMRPDGMHWNGVTNGYRAFADWNAADSLTVIFTGNAHTGAIDLLRREIVRMAAGTAVAAADIPRVIPVSLSAATQKRLEGTYDTGGGSISAVRFLSPTLMLFGDRALVPTSDSTFFSTADYATVTFAGGASGAVERIEWGPGTWGTGEQGPRFPRVIKAAAEKLNR